VEVLTGAFRELRGLKHVVLTFWHGGEYGQRDFFGRYAVSGHFVLDMFTDFDPEESALGRRADHASTLRRTL